MTKVILGLTSENPFKNLTKQSNLFADLIPSPRTGLSDPWTMVISVVIFIAALTLLCSLVWLVHRWLLKNKAKIVLSAYSLLVVFGCIYVPWKADLPKAFRGSTRSLPWSPLWSPPHDLAVVDLERIALELVGITVLFGLFFWLLGGFGALQRKGRVSPELESHYKDGIASVAEDLQGLLKSGALPRSRSPQGPDGRS